MRESDALPDLTTVRCTRKGIIGFSEIERSGINLKSIGPGICHSRTNDIVGCGFIGEIGVLSLPGLSVYCSIADKGDKAECRDNNFHNPDFSFLKPIVNSN